MLTMPAGNSGAQRALLLGAQNTRRPVGIGFESIIRPSEELVSAFLCSEDWKPGGGNFKAAQCSVVAQLLLAKFIIKIGAKTRAEI